VLLMGLGQHGDREGEVVSWEQEIALFGTCIYVKSKNGEHKNGKG